MPAIALGHIERASYWPDPAPDRSIKPAAGGKFPKARSLASALNEAARGETRVVCKANSLQLLRRSIRRARKHGYDIRPTDHRRLSAKRARGLRSVNRKLKRMCEYRQIQPAVTASGNHDRIIVMPGVYAEPTSRGKPTNDPRCWFSNVAAPGKQIVTDPSPLPDCDNGRDPGSSMGNGPDPENEAELGRCLAGFSTVGYDPDACPWFEQPPKPTP